MSVFIIAEIGINHNGDRDMAIALIDMAHAAGVDAVKFQKRDIDTVYTEAFLAGPRESPWGTTQRAQKEGLELTSDDYDIIDAHCRKLGLPWLASAWDLTSQAFLQRYELAYNKVASAMLTHRPFLEMVAAEGKPTFISTGMSSFAQIDDALAVFTSAGCPFTLMHCVSTYPCPDEDCNIRMVTTLKARYQCPVGYSGHEIGLLPSVLAVASGAEVIERHITLDRAMYGSDQSASIERRGLEILVRDCRSVAPMLGDGVKRVLPAEKKTEQSLRYFRES